MSDPAFVTRDQAEGQGDMDSRDHALGAQRGSRLASVAEAAILAEIAKRYRWRRLNISFSGGRTSAYMTKLLLDTLGRGRRNVVVTFANTGQEHEETLSFVRDCDEAWDLGVVWVEAKVDPRKNVGTRHRVVTFETASRKGEPFEATIAKYGLPGPGFLHCTRELKANAIKSYLRSIGWSSGTYDTAIGIRADEIDRMQADAERRGFKYWLAKLGVKSPDIFAAFVHSNVVLNLVAELGNCVWCWKKSLWKLIWLMRNQPWVFEFPRRMEIEHAFSGAGDGRRRFIFRHHLTVADLEEMATWPDERVTAWLASKLKVSKAEALAAMSVADECSGVCDAEVAA